MPMTSKGIYAFRYTREYGPFKLEHVIINYNSISFCTVIKFNHRMRKKNTKIVGKFIQIYYSQPHYDIIIFLTFSFIFLFFALGQHGSFICRCTMSDNQLTPSRYKHEHGGPSDSHPHSIFQGPKSPGTMSTRKQVNRPRISNQYKLPAATYHRIP